MWKHFIFALAGASFLYFKKLYFGRNLICYIELLMERYGIPKPKKPVFIMAFKLMDTFLFILSGAFLACILTCPDDEVKALTAGLGWTGLIGLEKRS